MKAKKVLFFFCLFIGFAGTLASAKAKSTNTQPSYKNFGIIISGPSGVGKTTIIEKLAELHSELSVSVSATTRKRRKGEIDGKHYYFIDKDKFQKLVNKDEFIEYAENYGNYYGSPRRNYTEAMENNQDIVFALSAEGMQNAVKNKDMDFITIFISAPSDDILLKRLKNRKTETNKQVAERFKKAKHEMSYAYLYDYTVYNHDIKNAVKIVEAIYLAEKFKRLK